MEQATAHCTQARTHTRIASHYCRRLFWYSSCERREGGRLLEIIHTPINDSENRTLRNAYTMSFVRSPLRRIRDPLNMRECTHYCKLKNDHRTLAESATKRIQRTTMYLGRRISGPTHLYAGRDVALTLSLSPSLCLCLLLSDGDFHAPKMKYAQRENKVTTQPT